MLKTTLVFLAIGVALINGKYRCNPDNDFHYDDECCSKSDPCDEGEGDCDHDRDCKHELICGSNNCPPPFPPNADCCHRECDGNPRYDYDPYFRECCSVLNPCKMDEGDCDKDSECEDDLVCGRDNCGKPFPSEADCCVKGPSVREK